MFRTLKRDIGNVNFPVACDDTTRAGFLHLKVLPTLATPFFLRYITNGFRFTQYGE